MRIPKILHQTYKSEDTLPPTYARCQTVAKRLHEGWTYMFWTDERMEEEVRQSFPELYPVFSILPRMIMKIDVFRYCLMWKYGGVYADLDYLFRKPFDMMNEGLVLPISRRQSKMKYQLRFGNSVFASSPGHPFWRLVLDDILHNKERLLVKSDSDVMDGDYGTGPGFLTRMYWTCPEDMRESITTPNRFLFHPFATMTDDELDEKGSYGVHLCASLWTNGAL